jgi:hypothetical protein
MGDLDYSNNNDDGHRLSSLYEGNSDNFRKVFAILLGIGLFFLLTVILPYFLNIYELDQNTIQTVKENRTIQQSNADIHKSNLTITNIKKSINSLSNNINKTKSMMDTEINKVNNSLSSVDKLLGNISDPTTLANLKNVLNKTQYKLNGTLRFAAIAIQSFYNSSSNYEDRYEKKFQKLNQTYTQLAQAKMNLQKAIQNRDELTDRLDNLSQRWKEIQTPYGNFPIDFTNLLAIFPIAISTGFFLCCFWLAESIRHRAFIDVKRTQDPNVVKRLDPNTRDTRVDPNAIDANRSEVSIIAPLWLDPIIKQNKIIQYLVLSLPVMIFAFSVAMIIFAWTHAPAPPFPTSSEVNEVIYYFAYSACSVLIAHGYWKVQLRVQKYEQAIWKC